MLFIPLNWPRTTNDKKGTLSGILCLQNDKDHTFVASGPLKVAVNVSGGV